MFVMVFSVKLEDLKLTFAKVFVIAIPSYSVAVLTEKIIYVVPTIAMMMIANSIELGNLTNSNRVDTDDQAIDEDGSPVADIDGGL